MNEKQKNKKNWEWNKMRIILCSFVDNCQLISGKEFMVKVRVCNREKSGELKKKLNTMYFVYLALYWLTRLHRLHKFLQYYSLLCSQLIMFTMCDLCVKEKIMTFGTKLYKEKVFIFGFYSFMFIWIGNFQEWKSSVCVRVFNLWYNFMGTPNTSWMKHK